VDELADVTITAEDADWLAGFIHRLISDRLAACGNIIPAVRSVYVWDGRVQEGAEALALIHTRRSLVDAIIERVDREHPDQTPQVLVLAVSAAHPGYREWLLESTGRPEAAEG